MSISLGAARGTELDDVEVEPRAYETRELKREARTRRWVWKAREQVGGGGQRRVFDARTSAEGGRTEHATFLRRTSHP